MARTGFALCIIWVSGLLAALHAAASLSDAMRLSIVPQRSIVDRPVETIVRSRPGSIVEMTLTMQRFGLTFSSEAKFRVPVSGVVELSRQAPLSGSYTRVDAMGLFWSAVPTAAVPNYA